VGFSRSVPYVGFNGHYLPVPLFLMQVFEWAFGKLPWQKAQRLGRKPIFKNFLKIQLRAIK